MPVARDACDAASARAAANAWWKKRASSPDSCAAGNFRHHPPDEARPIDLDQAVRLLESPIRGIERQRRSGLGSGRFQQAGGFGFVMVMSGQTQ